MYEYSAQQAPGFERRLQVRPGLTGLAQIYGNRDNPEEKLSYDLKYIREKSLWLDIKLLILSVLITIRGRWENRGRKV